MFQIAIDTNTMPVSPAVYADEYRGRALPTVLPLVQGFRGNLRVYFLGEHAPSENAAVALYLRALQSKEKLVQTGLGTRGISDAGNVYYDVPLAADTTALSAVLGNRENVIMRAGIVANDVTASPQTNFEWQLNIAVSASAIGTGEKPPVSPNAIEEHNNDVSAHPFILQKIAAAEVDVSGLRTSIAGVSESLNATNTNLNNAKSELSTEISEVAAALSAETISRENEDAAIRKALATESAERGKSISALRSEVYTKISSETTARENEDAAIRVTLESENTAREAQAGRISEALTRERSERIERDSELSKYIASLCVNTSSQSEGIVRLCDMILAEKSCRKAADSEIKVKVQNLCTGFTAVSSSVGMQSTRISNLCSEIYKKINSERTCRTAADNVLQGSINTLNSDVAAIEGNIQTLENRIVSTVEALTEHTNNSNPHWELDAENGVFKKTNLNNGEGILVASYNTASYSYRGIYIQQNCGCFSPNGSLLKFGNNGCISLLSDSGGISISSTSEDISLWSGPNGISLSSRGISLSSMSEGISLSSMSESISLSLSSEGISLSSGPNGISLSSGSGGISLSSGSGERVFYFFMQSGSFYFNAENRNLTLTQKCNRCSDCDFGFTFCIDNFDAVKFSSKNYNNEIGNYAFCATAVSLCRSGGNVLQGNPSMTALYFGTTPFATSKIDSGSRVVCFGNPLGKVNIKAGNGGRIDICATCVYVNGVKIST